MDIPEELIENDILLRLPVKSLFRFRCVSKRWCAQIKTNAFVKRHLNHHHHDSKTNKHISLLFNNDRKLYSARLYDNTCGHARIHTPLQLDHPVDNTLNSQYFTVIVGACNGLICLKYLERIIIWNPATRKHVKVPYPIQDYSSDRRMCGFGYDNSASGDYKVVIMPEFASRSSSNTKLTYVYSLKLNSWRKITDAQRKFNVYKDYPGALVCGSIHWLVREKPKRNVDHVSFSIAAFDLVTEDCTMVTLLDCLSHGKLQSCYVLELGGCLSFSYKHSNINSGGAIHVWVLKDYGMMESWTILLSLSCPHDTSNIDYSYPLAYTESGQEVLLRNNTKLLWYNLEKETVKILDCHNLVTYHHVIYSESLVTLGEKAENDEKGMNQEKKSGNKRSEY